MWSSTFINYRFCINYIHFFPLLDGTTRLSGSRGHDSRIWDWKNRRPFKTSPSPLQVQMYTGAAAPPKNEILWSNQMSGSLCRPGQRPRWAWHHPLQMRVIDYAGAFNDSHHLLCAEQTAGGSLLPIWLTTLKATSSCRTNSMYWNQGLISVPGTGTCTEKTMSLASNILATGWSKLRICWHLPGPQGASQSSATLRRLIHLVAR